MENDRKIFSIQERIRVVNEVNSINKNGLPVKIADVASRMGISVSTIYTWKKQIDNLNKLNPGARRLKERPLMKRKSDLYKKLKTRITNLMNEWVKVKDVKLDFPYQSYFDEIAEEIFVKFETFEHSNKEHDQQLTTQTSNLQSSEGYQNITQQNSILYQFNNQ